MFDRDKRNGTKIRRCHYAVQYVTPSNGTIETRVRSVVSLLNARWTTPWWRDNAVDIVQDTFGREHCGQLDRQVTVDR